MKPNLEIVAERVRVLIEDVKGIHEKFLRKDPYRWIILTMAGAIFTITLKELFTLT